MKTNLGVCLLAALSACAGASGAVRPPLQESEGELYVYLEPFPDEAGRLAVAVESLAALGPDDASIPLQLSLPELSARTARGHRLLAWGRLPPGNYPALLLKVKRATLAGEGRPSDLAVGVEPFRIEAPFTLSGRRATVVSLALDYGRSLAPGFAFAPAFAATVPRPVVPSLLGYCSNAGSDSITVFDKHARRVVAVIPTGRAPEGLAFDPRQPRAYVALSGEDQIAIIDINLGEEIGRIPLRPGDRPRELALTPDGRALVVTNAGSNTASFVDPVAAQEVERVGAGDEPGPLLLDASGGRAYVLNRRSSSITVLDLANRAVAATVGTEAEPIAARVNRAGTRLYVAQAGSTRLAVHALPGLSVATRVNVGLGAGALQLDPRTDQLLVAGARDDRIQVLDPLSFFPLRRIELDASASWLAVDPTENVLYALLPGRRSIAAVDLVSGRVIGALDVGAAPYQAAIAGARR